MTTRANKTPTDPHDSSQLNPKYGWRYVQRTLPNGTVEYDQVPLTLEDVLYPQMGDMVFHSDQHETIRDYLTHVLKAHLASIPHSRVFSDLGFVWDNGVGTLAPDIAVVFGIRKLRKSWSTFDVAQEGVRPTLIIEVTSPDTRQNDLQDKVELFAKVGVPLYIIIDINRNRKGERIELYGYRLTPTGYIRFLSDARGWLWLEPLKLWLAAEPGTSEKAGQIWLYDPDNNRLGDYIDIINERDAAEARAQAEAQARSDAEARLRLLEEELRRLRQHD